MKPGAVHISWHLLYSNEYRGKPQLGDYLMNAVRQIIASKEVPYFQMTSVGSHCSQEGRRMGRRNDDNASIDMMTYEGWIVIIFASSDFCRWLWEFFKPNSCNIRPFCESFFFFRCLCQWDLLHLLGFLIIKSLPDAILDKSQPSILELNFR